MTEMEWSLATRLMRSSAHKNIQTTLAMDFVVNLSSGPFLSFLSTDRTNMTDSGCQTAVTAPNAKTCCYVVIILRCHSGSWEVCDGASPVRWSLSVWNVHHSTHFWTVLSTCIVRGLLACFSDWVHFTHFTHAKCGMKNVKCKSV